jgi:glycosyltransferase involved in cell wall biosynthesis
MWNGAAYRTICSLLNTSDPQETIIHVHGYTKALSTSLVRSAQEKEFKVIFTLHDFFAACPNGAFFDFVRKRPCELVALSLPCITTNCDRHGYANKLFRVARAVVHRHLGAFPRGVKNYIVLSQKSTEVLRPYLPAESAVFSLPNPINVARSRPVDVVSNSGIVAVGRLDEQKGIEILLEAAQRTSAKLTLIGDGPLRKVAESHVNCRVTGWLSRTEVLSELAQV